LFGREYALEAVSAASVIVPVNAPLVSVSPANVGVSSMPRLRLFLAVVVFDTSDKLLTGCKNRPLRVDPVIYQSLSAVLNGEVPI
jgi:hypothetical protein